MRGAGQLSSPQRVPAAPGSERVSLHVHIRGDVSAGVCTCVCTGVFVHVCTRVRVYLHVPAPHCSPAPSAVRAPALNPPDPSPRGDVRHHECVPRVCAPSPSPPAAASPQLPNVPGLTPSPCTGASCGWTSSCGTWASTSAPAGRAGSRARTAATSTAPRYPAPSTPLVPAPIPAPGALWDSVPSSIGAGAAPLQTVPIPIPVPVPAARPSLRDELYPPPAAPSALLSCSRTVPGVYCANLPAEPAG